jgi:hypothetical protein
VILKFDKKISKILAKLFEFAQEKKNLFVQEKFKVCWRGKKNKNKNTH